MMPSLLASIATLLSVVSTTPATVGGWTTYLKPYRYSDLLVRGDTVWCSTREAGLLRFSLSGQRFNAITRFPNGLASNELSSLAYDRSGHLWIGTYGAGASRMSADGSSWALVNAFDGLPSDTVNVIETEGDSVWIGTPEGIAFWNGNVVAGSLPIFGQPSPFASNNVTGVVAHPESLWVATSSGVYVSARSTGLQFWSPLNAGLFNTNVQALVTNDTLMFCLAGGGVYEFLNGQWQPEGGVGNVLRLFHDGKVVLASTVLGLFRRCNGGWSIVNSEVSGATDEFNTFIPAPIGDGRYVAANQTGVIVQPSPTAASGWPTFTPDGPPDNDIRNLNLDGDAVWVNTNNHGIGRLTGGTWRIWSPTPSPCSGAGCDTTFLEPLFAWALLVDRQGEKWFGCWEYAVDEFDDVHFSPPRVTHHVINDGLGYAAHTRTWPSAADSSGGRWFGTDTPNLGVVPSIGIDYYDSSGVYVGNVNTANGLRGTKVHGLTVDKFGAVWFGISAAGIGRFTFSPGTLPIISDYVPGSDRLDVQGLVARGDTIWALTTHELQRYARSPLGFPLATYTIPEATPLFAANPLAVGPDGSPWVGTEAGMRVFHPDGSSEDFNIRNSPVAGNQIYAIRVDPRSGVVWISTSSGMNRLDPGYRPPPPPHLPSLNVSVYPNPIALNKTGIELRLTGNATSYSGSIVDLSGRRVRSFSGAADRSLIWDGLDQDGRRVRPGIYFVHVTAGGREATVRVAVIR